MSSAKYPVCLNVFPTLDAIELIQLNDQTGEIEKASSLPCAFDKLSRQLDDPERMAQTIRDLFNSNKIPFNTPTLMVLPSFFTRDIELPAEFQSEETRFALISEAERFYVFKKLEPHIDWIKLDETRVLYSAYPKAEIEKYMQVFEELRIPLVAIELSYFSIIRGLVATGSISEEIDENKRWSLMVINDNSFFCAMNEGLRILKTLDAPLSVSAEEEDAILQEIHQDFEGFTSLENFDKLVLVNNALGINTDKLITELNFNGQMVVVEQNHQTLKTRGGPEAQFPCSLEVIGGVFYNEFGDLPRMNLKVGSGEDMVTILNLRQNLFKVFMVVDVAVLLLCGLIWGIMQMMVMGKDAEVQNLAKQAVELGSGQTVEERSNVQRRLFVKKVADLNTSINDFVVKLGASVGEGVWLDTVDIRVDPIQGTQEIKVEGKSLSPEPIDLLKNELAQSLKRDDLEVGQLDRANGSDGQASYTWVIQTKAPEAAPAERGQAR